MVRLVDEAGVVRFQGELEGGAFQPVGVLLVAGPTDIHAGGVHPLRWTAMRDNAWAGHPLAAIPAGLGLSFAFDGTGNALTTTTAGVWAFSLGVAFVSDATWKGRLVLDGGTRMGQAGDAGNVNPLLSVCEVVQYPAGAIVEPNVQTETGATAPALDAYSDLTIIRLA